MIPSGKWTCMTLPQPLRSYAGVSAPPRDRIGTSWDVALGPNDLQDTNGSVATRYWMAALVNNTIELYKNDNGWVKVNWSVVIEGLDSFSLSFDGLGKPVIAYEQDNNVFIYFHDSQLENYTHLHVDVGRTPKVTFDIKENTGDSSSDVILAYVGLNDIIYTRLQRDRYAVAYNTGVSHEDVRIDSLAISKDNRLQIKYKFPDKRDGALLLSKCLETEHLIATDMRNKSLEVNFRITNAPSWCDIKKWYFADKYLSSYTVVEHAGKRLTLGSDNEGLFGMSFTPLSPQNSESVGVVVYAGAAAEGKYYLATTLHNHPFQSGDFSLKFIHTEDEVLGIVNKRVVLTRDNVVLIDQICTDLAPDVDEQLPAGSVRNRLRFGASVLSNTQTQTVYWRPYTATFSNISVTFDGVTTTWDDTNKLTKQSTPQGNDMTLRRPSMESYTFVFAG